MAVWREKNMEDWSFTHDGSMEELYANLQEMVISL